MTEYLDYYDSNMNFIGTETRETVHKKGLWHKTIHCWLYDDYGNIFFQIRADTNKLYTTASGHVISGETIRNAFNREVKEEIGLEIKNKELELIQILVWKNKTTTKEDNAFANVYMCNIDEPKFMMDKTEVIGVVKINAKSCLDLLNGNIKQAKAIKYSDDKIEQIYLTPNDFLLMPNELLLIKYGTVLEAIIKKFS